VSYGPCLCSCKVNQTHIPSAPLCTGFSVVMLCAGICCVLVCHYECPLFRRSELVLVNSGPKCCAGRQRCLRTTGQWKNCWRWRGNCVIILTYRLTISASCMRTKWPTSDRLLSRSDSCCCCCCCCCDRPAALFSSLMSRFKKSGET